ncbi:hypothetical protein TYRP_022128 [Tyrophagus putrescentiae]|nr:hypothetical protein TYRP_022128 [Tyrophagus putrescentiae]
MPSSRNGVVREMMSFSNLNVNLLKAIFGLNGSAGSVLSGNGVGGILIPALSFGVGTIISIYLSAPISGGHLNPAVTIGFAATVLEITCGSAW